MNKAFAQVSCLVFVGLSTWLSACTKTGPESPKPGQVLFLFDRATIREFSIAKNDPKTGDSWTAESVRQDSKTSYEDPHWELRGATVTGVSEIQDRLADGNFIEHLLDTLKTLQYSMAAPKGPLSSFGLETPRFVIRWKTENASFELKLGDENKFDEGAYFAQVRMDTNPNDTVISVRGAATKMLEFLSAFSKIRKQTLATLSTDETDEVQLKKGMNVIFFAQREGAEWTDRAHKPIKKVDVGALLDRITHARVKEFIDDPVLASEIRKALKSAVFEAVLTPRKGPAQSLRFVWFQTKKSESRSLYVDNSSRSGAVFEAYVEIIHFFELTGK